MALILDNDGLLDAADGFAGWDDALVDDTLAHELEQERAVELESELEQDGPLTTTPSWRTQRKKLPPPARSG